MTAMRIAPALAALVLASGAARADVHVHPAAKVAIDVPPAWRVSHHAGVVIARAPDDTAALLFWVVDKPDLAAAAAELAAATKGKLAKLVWGKPKDADINGLKGQRKEGTAELRGRPAHVSLAMVRTGATKKVAIVLGGVDDRDRGAHGATLAHILDSLAPVK